MALNILNVNVILRALKMFGSWIGGSHKCWKLNLLVNIIEHCNWLFIISNDFNHICFFILNLQVHWLNEEDESLGSSIWDSQVQLRDSNLTFATETHATFRIWGAFHFTKIRDVKFLGWKWPYFDTLSLRV